MLQIYLSMVNSSEDKTLVEFLYSEYRSFMYNVAYSVLYNKADSEDAVHEAFLRIINNLSRFKRYSCKENASYLVIVVRGIALNMINKRNNYSELDEEYPDQTNVEKTVLANIEYEQILANIEQLSPGLRDIATLYFVHEWNAQEIADFLDVTRNNVYVAITRARKELLKRRNQNGN